MEDNCNLKVSMTLMFQYQIRVQFSTRNTFDIKGFNIGVDKNICETDFKAWSKLSRIMFYFEHIKIDCQYGYFEFFDGDENPVLIPGLPAQLCGEDMPTDIYNITSEIIRIRYTTKTKSEQENVMRLIFTAFKDGDGECGEFTYTCSNGLCIDNDLGVCTEFNSCGDNSTCRANPSNPSSPSSSSEGGLSTGAIVGIVIGCVCFMLLVACCWYCCRKDDDSDQANQYYHANQSEPVSLQTQEGFDVKGQPQSNSPPSAQPPDGAPSTGQPPYRAQPTAPPPYRAPPPAQPPYGALPTGQSPYGAPSTGQPPYEAPPTGQPPYEASPPTQPANEATPTGKTE